MSTSEPNESQEKPDEENEMMEDMLMNYMFYGSGDANPVDVQECKETMRRMKDILLTIVLVALVVAQVMAHSNMKLVETHIDQWV